MAGKFSQNFSLTDIFNNKNLKGKLPLINYKETEENGKVKTRTSAKTINRLVFDISTSAARLFYKPINATRTGDTMIISGNLIGDLDGAVEAVYNALLGQKAVMMYTVNNADLIRSALKEAEKNKRQNGINSKIYLRAQSMEQIEGMSKPQLQALMNDIMENIFYGDDFPKTQKKYKLEDLPVKSPYNYEQRQEIWKKKVGDM